MPRSAGFALRGRYGLGVLRPPHTVRRIPGPIVRGLEWLDVRTGHLPLVRDAEIGGLCAARTLWAWRAATAAHRAPHSWPNRARPRVAGCAHRSLTASPRCRDRRALRCADAMGLACCDRRTPCAAFLAQSCAASSGWMCAQVTYR